MFFPGARETHNLSELNGLTLAATLTVSQHHEEMARLRANDCSLPISSIDSEMFKTCDGPNIVVTTVGISRWLPALTQAVRQEFLHFAF